LTLLASTAGSNLAFHQTVTSGRDLTYAPNAPREGDLASTSEATASPRIRFPIDPIDPNLPTVDVVQGLLGYTLVAGKTSTLRIFTPPSHHGRVREIETLVIRPDGSTGLIRWVGDGIVSVAADDVSERPSHAVRIPGAELPLVGQYHFQINLKDGAGQIVSEANLNRIEFLPTKDLRLAVDRIWSGTPTKPGEEAAAHEGVRLLAAMYPVRDGVAGFDGDRTAGVRYVYNDAPAGPPNQDGHLGAFFDAWRARPAGLDSADVGIAYRFPNVGEGMGANANHNHKGLPYNVVVWGAPLGWTFSHESGHNLGLVPRGDPHWDGGAHSKDQFIHRPDALSGYDASRNRPWSETMFDIMFASGSGDAHSYGFNSWDWEYIRQRLTMLPSTGPTGPNIGWQSLGGHSLRSQVSVATNFDGRREVFAVGGDGVLYFQFETSPGGAWSGWRNLQGTALVGPVRATRFSDGRLVVFVRDAEGRVLSRSQASPGGGWTPWTIFASEVQDFAIAHMADGNLVMVASSRGGARDLRFIVQVTPTLFSGWGSAGGFGFAGPVSVATTGDGAIVVFAIADDGGVYARRRSGGVWSGWTRLTELSSAASQIHAARGADGRLVVFFLKSDGSIAYVSETSPGGAFAAQVVLAGQTFQKGFTVVENIDGRLEVLGVATNGSVHARFELDGARPGVWSTWTSLGERRVLGGIGAASDLGAGIDIFAVDVAGALSRGARPATPTREIGAPIDSDGDGRSDDEDFCTDVDGTRKFVDAAPARLIVRGIDTPAKVDNTIFLEGELRLPPGMSFASFNPSRGRGGLIVVVTTADGRRRYNASLGRAFAGLGTTGWLRSGDTWAFMGNALDEKISGVTQAQVTDLGGGRIRVRVSARNARLGKIGPAAMPLQAVFLLERTAGASQRGRCGESLFARSECQMTENGAAIACQRS
jgi:hypothetical protein